MKLEELIEGLGDYALVIVAIFILIPAVAYGFGKLARGEKGGKSPYKYVYSFLVYLSCVPGMFSSVLTAYGLLIIRTNLLKVDFVVYFVPIISMAITLVIINKSVAFKHIPGFDRLYGLFVVLGLSFAAAFFLLQTRIWILFHSPLMTLFLLAAVLFAILQAGMMKVKGGGRKKFEVDIEIPDIEKPENK